MVIETMFLSMVLAAMTQNVMPAASGRYDSGIPTGPEEARSGITSLVFTAPKYSAIITGQLHQGSLTATTGTTGTWGAQQEEMYSTGDREEVKTVLQTMIIHAG